MFSLMLKVTNCSSCSLPDNCDFISGHNCYFGWGRMIFFWLLAHHCSTNWPLIVSWALLLTPNMPVCKPSYLLLLIFIVEMCLLNCSPFTHWRGKKEFLKKAMGFLVEKLLSRLIQNPLLSPFKCMGTEKGINNFVIEKEVISVPGYPDHTWLQRDFHLHTY